MSDPYTWFRVFHIFFVIAWMVGIFYLPRIMVHYQEGKKAGDGVTRLVIMARKLLNFSTLMALFATGCGTVLWLYFGITGKWLYVKLCAVAIFLIHHHVCARFVRQMEKDELKRSSLFFRWFNEYPVLLMLLIIILAIFKPF